MLFIGINAIAQQITKYEYWLDQNYREKNIVSTTSGEIEFSADVSKLLGGIHILNFRAQDSEGRWSAPSSTYFFCYSGNQVSRGDSQYEYWIDGNADKKVQVKGYDKIVNLSLDVNNLITGLHTLSFRAADKYGRWSAPQTSYFLVTSGKKGKDNIKAYRYWFNDAVDNSVVQLVSPAVIPLTVETKLAVKDAITALTPETITMTNDGEGHMRLATKNVLHTQYCTEDGRWTQITTDTFAVAINDKDIDLTGFVTNPDATNKWTGWKTSGDVIGTQNAQAWADGSNYFRLGSTSKKEWASAMEQTITGLPAGTYILTVKGRAAEGVEMEVSANGFSETFTGTGTEGGELENGWTERSIIFTTDGMPFIIKASGTAKATGKWMDVADFRLTYTNASNASLTVNMPANANMQQYKNLKLQLTSVSSKLSVTTSNAMDYTFQGLTAGVAYNIMLANRYGQTVAKKEGITIGEGDNSVTLSELAALCNAEAVVTGSGNSDLTEKARIAWTMADGTAVSEESYVSGLLAGTKLLCNVALGDSLGCIYREVKGQECLLSEKSNRLNISLVPIEHTAVKGMIVDANGGMALRTNISATSIVNGKYSKTLTATADTKGMFALDCMQDSLHIIVSADGYLDCVIDTMSTSATMDLGTLRMKEITGVVITPRLQYAGAIEEGEDNSIGLYTDSENIDYSVVNKTGNAELKDIVVQSGKIIIKSGAAAGDRLAVSIRSRKGDFDDATAETTVAEDETANIAFDLVEKGGVKATYEFSGNKENIAMLYDAEGVLVERAFYNGNTVTLSHIADGRYTLLSMGKTLMLDAILNMADLRAIGLAEGTDYILSDVNIKAGTMAAVSNEVIPTIDETLFYYTGAKTSFTANKSSVVVGNYVTLTSVLDFKEEYADDVDDLSLVVDLPAGMEYVKGSAIIGTALAPCSIDGSRLTISLNRTNYQERIRFCVVPTEGGMMMPSAFVGFSLDGDVLQPIGSVSVTAKDMSISVPSTVAKKEVTVSGVAVPYSQVTVYDGNTQIGQVSAKADGNWMVKSELVNPYNLSSHSIYAHVLTPQEIEMNTEAVNVLYDKNAIEVKTVTMLNTAHTAANLALYEYRTVFDFQNPENEPSVYWYWPSYPDFTFLVDFTNNDPAVVKDVVLYVFTDDNKVVSLYPQYDEKIDKYVVKSKFNSYSLPYNVSVDYWVDNDGEIDRQELNELFDIINSIPREITEDVELVNRTFDSGSEEDINALLLNLGITDEFVEDCINSDSLQVVFESMSLEEQETALKDFFDNLREELNDDVNTQNILKSFNFDPYWKNLEFDGVRISRLSVLDSDTIDIESKGFEKFVCDDGSTVFIKQNETEFDIIDISRGIRYCIVFAQNSNAAKMMKAAIFTSENIKQWTSILLSVVDHVSKVFKHLEKTIDDLLKPLVTKKRSLAGKKGWIGRLKKTCNPALLHIYNEELKNLDKQLSLVSNAIKGIQKIAKAITKYMPIAKYAIMASNAIVDINKLYGIYKSIPDPCPDDQINASDYQVDVFQKAGFTFSYYMAYLSYDVSLTVANISQLAASIPLGGTTVVSAILTEIVKFGTELLADYIKNKALDSYVKNMTSKINKLKCKNPEPPEPPKPVGSGAPNVKDPSGYVYEAVSSNRLEGVTATIYQKVTTEDMYGDKHDSVVKWDAEPYSQKNPIKTDMNGLYAWDVPNGLWQVKFEKEGYETVYSDWLPVPPPQLDINVPMYQSVQPEVTEARGFESGVDFRFSKYMRPETFEEGCVTLTRDGKPLDGQLKMLDIEKEPLDGVEYASHVKFIPTQSLHVGDKVTLTVSRKVKSYCGVAMEKDYTVVLTIQPEIKEIAVDSVVNICYGDKSEIEVAVLPADAAKGKKLRVMNGTSSIISTTADELTLDANGKARILVNGDLPGMGALMLSVEGSDVKAQVMVNVVIAAAETAAPEASIASGSTVACGSLVVLSCPTDGATIYYTTDGSCPCDEQSRIRYTEPIVIDHSMTIKAMAVGINDTESEIAEFTYFVSADVTSVVERDETAKVSYQKEGNQLIVSVGGENIKDVTLTDISGFVVTRASDSGRRISLDINSVKEGIYILNIRTESKSYATKINIIG